MKSTTSFVQGTLYFTIRQSRIPHLAKRVTQMRSVSELNAVTSEFADSVVGLGL